MSEKLNLKYEDLNLIKHFDEITSLLKENTEYLKQSYKKPKKASYTLLSETLKYKLEHLTLYPETNQKVELIEKIINEIQNDVYIKDLIKKIKNNDIVNFVENENIRL
jgi:2-hydroxy-3-keto-5-methylthiopentenyl-1-phosphate phosphatase